MTPTELRRRRAALSLTQRQLGDLLGVTYHTVLRWENGRVPIPGMADLSVGFIESTRFTEKQFGRKRK